MLQYFLQVYGIVKHYPAEVSDCNIKTLLTVMSVECVVTRNNCWACCALTSIGSANVKLPSQFQERELQQLESFFCACLAVPGPLVARLVLWQWMELSPADNWSLVVFLRGLYWDRPCLMSFLIIWMRGMSAPSVNLKMSPMWEEVLISLGVGGPTEGSGQTG